jgi:hypothetical protein
VVTTDKSQPPRKASAREEAARQRKCAANKGKRNVHQRTFSKKQTSDPKYMWWKITRTTQVLQTFETTNVLKSKFDGTKRVTTSDVTTRKLLSEGEPKFKETRCSIDAVDVPWQSEISLSPRIPKVDSLKARKAISQKATWIQVADKERGSTGGAAASNNIFSGVRKVAHPQLPPFPRAHLLVGRQSVSKPAVATDSDDGGVLVAHSNRSQRQKTPTKPNRGGKSSKERRQASLTPVGDRRSGKQPGATSTTSSAAQPSASVASAKRRRLDGSAKSSRSGRSSSATATERHVPSFKQGDSVMAAYMDQYYYHGRVVKVATGSSTPVYDIKFSDGNKSTTSDVQSDHLLPGTPVIAKRNSSSKGIFAPAVVDRDATVGESAGSKVYQLVFDEDGESVRVPVKDIGLAMPSHEGPVFSPEENSISPAKRRRVKAVSGNRGPCECGVLEHSVDESCLGPIPVLKGRHLPLDKYFFVVSGFRDRTDMRKHAQAQITALGGHIVESVSAYQQQGSDGDGDEMIMLAESLRTTKQILSALAAGVPCVKYTWMVELCKTASEKLGQPGDPRRALSPAVKQWKKFVLNVCLKFHLLCLMPLALPAAGLTFRVLCRPAIVAGFLLLLVGLTCPLCDWLLLHLYLHDLLSAIPCAMSRKIGNETSLVQCR